MAHVQACVAVDSLQTEQDTELSPVTSIYMTAHAEREADRNAYKTDYTLYYKDLGLLV